MNSGKDNRNEKIQKIFVYGTLRPDIKAPWSDKLYKNEKFNINYEKGYITNAALQLFKYHKYTNLRIDKKWLTNKDIVHGYILESSNIDETLEVLDLIEDYPFLYTRITCSCFNVTKQQEETVYLYIINKNNNIMTEAFECIYNDVKILLEKNL